MFGPDGVAQRKTLKARDLDRYPISEEHPLRVIVISDTSPAEHCNGHAVHMENMVS